MRQHRERDRYAWGVVALFWFAYFLNHADRQVIFSIFPLIQQDLGLTRTELGLIGSAFFWVYAVVVPVAGSLGDRLNRKGIIVAALFVWSAATFGSGLASTFVALLALRALTGVGEGCYYPSAASIITDYHGTRTRAFAMSVHQTSIYIGIIVSGALAGYVGEHYGWRSAFLGFGGVGLLYALVLSRALVEPVRGRADREEFGEAWTAPLDGGSRTSEPLPLAARLREATRSPTAFVLMLAFVGMNFVNAAYLTWMPTLLYQKFGYGLAAAGFHATFYHHVGALLGVLIGGRLADRYAVRSRLSRPLIQVLGLLGGAPFIYLMAHAEAPRVVFLALGLFGVFRGLYDSNLFASLFEVVRPEARATATGLMIAGAFLVGGTASVVTGAISERIGLGPALALTSLGYALGGALLALDCLLWFRRDAARMQAGFAAAGAR